MLSIFDQMTQVSAEEVERMLPLVSSQRRAEALKYKQTSGQFACLKTYMMLRQMLTQLTWVSEDVPLIFERNEHGKPALQDYPHIHFNISHCRNALAVVVDKQNIGVDIESFRTPTPSLLNYTMNPTEIEDINKSNNPTQTFTAYWTKKEALYKYLGTGICGDIPNLLCNIPPEVQLDTTFNIEGGYAITIAQKH